MLGGQKRRVTSTYAGVMTEQRRTVIRHPNSAYLIVAFAVLCTTAIVRSPLQALLYLLPLTAVVYVVRTATIVDEAGLTARAIFGAAAVAWDDLAGLRLSDSGAVYAVDRSGFQVKLPVLRSTKLQPLITAAAGRIPDPNTEPSD
jgi:hypothetical protein